MSTNNDVTVVQQDNTAMIRKPDPVATVTPLADIYETPDAYVLLLDMPGATKDSISITMDQSTLVIRASVEGYVRENATLLFNEIPGVGFQRTFNL
ncbi:Hsp20/alpha crystallin family protein, partial [Sphingobacteriales bacterium CHB3]|nr:Hsp20/alpha crystallin family protein [Sphingobacteriales bacterium CHB3]